MKVSLFNYSMLGCTLSTPPKNISNLPLLWTFVARFLQPGLTSSTIFHKNFTRFSYCQPYKIFKLIMGSIPNGWKHLLRTETSQKSLLKIFCYNNKVTWKVKDSQKLSILYKRIHFLLPLNPAIHRMGGQHIKYSVSQM